MSEKDCCADEVGSVMEGAMHKLAVLRKEGLCVKIPRDPRPLSEFLCI